MRGRTGRACGSGVGEAKVKDSDDRDTSEIDSGENEAARASTIERHG